MYRLVLLLTLILALTTNSLAETFGPGTHIVNGLIVTVPEGASVTITSPTSVVTLGPGTPITPTPDKPIIPPTTPVTDGERVDRFRTAAKKINEPETAANLSALFQGLAQRSDPTAVIPLYPTPEKLKESLTAGLDIFLIGSKKQAEWAKWRDLLTDEWVKVAQFGGDMSDYSKLMYDASESLSDASGNQAFDITTIFKILEILGDPTKTRFQKIIAILPLILTLFTEGN